jgi:TetR/AcrR family transcriptional regulator
MTSKERIFGAAVQVFAKKGRHGAKMEEIASVAQINKAMIYYLFSSKDNLYIEVLKMILSELDNAMNKCEEEDMAKKLPPDKLLVLSIEHQFTAFSANIDHTRILLEAMSSHADELRLAVQAMDVNMYNKPRQYLEKIIADGIAQGLFRNIDSEQLLGSIFGMNLVFYMTRSFADILNFKIADEAEYLEMRKKNIIDLVMNGVMCKN